MSISNFYMLDIWSEKQAVPQDSQDAIWNCQAISVAHGQTATSHVLEPYENITQYWTSVVYSGALLEFWQFVINQAQTVTADPKGVQTPNRQKELESEAASVLTHVFVFFVCFYLYSCFETIQIV